MSRILGFIYGIAAYAIFCGALLYMAGFLAGVVVPKDIDDGTVLSTGLALAIDLALIALFGLQHSIMARPGFKRRIAHRVPATVERSTFVLASSLVLIVLFWQWRPMTQVLWQVEGVAAILLWAVFASGLVLALLSTFVIDHFDLFGLRQVTLNLLRKRYSHPPFKVASFYRVVRHPLYLGFLVAFWSTPHMTLGRFIFAAGMSAYILIGVHCEERDLETQLGDDYRRYRDRVPMLLPRPGSMHEVVKPAKTGTTRSP